MNGWTEQELIHEAAFQYEWGYSSELEEAARECIARLKAEAWDEGAEFAWQRTGEGWNGEYTTYTHDGAVSFIEANDDRNPYRDET